MSRKPRRKHVWLDLVACFLIPAYTLLFAGGVQWFGTNFSVIAVTGRDHYRGFVYWGVLAGAYFLVMLIRLALTLPPLPKVGVWGLTLAACLSLAYALAIPYLPAQFPKYAALHVVLAAGACALLMGALLTVILTLRRRDRAGYDGLLRVWLLIVAGCAVLFLIPRMVSTALEVFFTISATLLTRKLWLVRQGDS